MDGTSPLHDMIQGLVGLHAATVMVIAIVAYLIGWVWVFVIAWREMRWRCLRLLWSPTWMKYATTTPAARTPLLFASLGVLTVLLFVLVSFFAP